ncbi:eukaryotic translation initiation factor 3 subunit E-B [Brachionus plicatilis]|uniref:Eukaryotic translation initiation factor 3 subunit E n=1 Tax=Brachionus plicatilis TaxID=10195 RepID=A0A3M7QXU2_BRAPC|nr:eukaryotic translation initiation factor 3 subunit E-B [Brachionus plicatilis]
MSEYDLTLRIAKHLDRHMIFPLLEFLSSRKIYDEKSVLSTKLDLLNKTNMVDFAVDCYKHLYHGQEVPENLIGKRKNIVNELVELRDLVSPFIDLFEREDVKKLLETDRDHAIILDHLRNNYPEYKPDETIPILYRFAKFQYDCGDYEKTASILEAYRILVPGNDQHISDVLWGKLASDILIQNWEQSAIDLAQLREWIDKNEKETNALQTLQQRCWLIHWGLYVYFHHPKGREQLIDLFFTHGESYLNVVQTTCPHILRYITAAAIISKRRKNIMKDLVKIIQQEAYNYRDPITELVECLYVNFDFDGVQIMLGKCDQVLANDFFLAGFHDEFIENARLFSFETFCRIHQCITIKMIAEKLNMTNEDAEKWIVDLIRNARLDAKIDSKLGHVVFGAQAISPYQQIIEKTKNLTMRANAISISIDKKMKSVDSV